VAQPSKAGAAVLFLFGLPFFAFGAYGGFAFLTSAPSVHNNTNSIAGAIFASVFAIIGGGLMFGAVYGYQRQTRDTAVKEANPQSPWLWRCDWAQGRALSNHRTTFYAWWVCTVLTGMLFLPMAWINLPQLLRTASFGMVFLLGLCLIPAALLVGAVRATIRRRRYGRTYFEFATLPFSPGKRMSGQIHLRLETAADHGIDLRLSCIRRLVTGSGKQRSVNDIQLWQQEKNVPQPAFLMGSADTCIPVEFDVPEDAYETNHDVPRDQLLWMLHAQADVPGVDYCDDFEIPVFGLTPHAARASAAAPGAGWSVEIRRTPG
jgi:hypothetical protein